MSQMQEAYIVSALRTPVAKAKGGFRNTRPDDLLAYTLSSTMKKFSQINFSELDDVIVGCAMPEAEQGMNVARIALLLAGLPESIPGFTVNRFCASGLEAIAIAAHRIMLGAADMIIAGGTESMTMVPMGGHKMAVNPAIFESAKEHEAIAYCMGITAEKVAEKWKISRSQQDEYALASHKRAIQAIQNNEFKDEIIAVNTVEKLVSLKTNEIVTNTKKIYQDEGPRNDTSLEALAKLPTIFCQNGTVTAGNTSQMSDGAAALLLVSEKVLKRYDLQPLAKFVSYAVAGVAPEHMGIGPVQAIPKALNATKLKLNNIDWIELNEAFAAQTVAVMQELKLNHEKVNPLGGAIALGHPLGATGAIRAATLIHALRRHRLKNGMVTMCIGTGMGAAGIFQAL